jgi:predicted PurR-regulated permease PerM
MSPKIRPLVRRSRSERRVSYALKIVALVILCAVVLAAVLQFIARVPSVAVIVIGAIFFTYIIYPIVRAIHARGVSLGVSILTTYALIGAIVVLGLTFVVPPLVDDSTSVVQAAPTFAATARTWVTNPANPVIARLPPIARDELAKLPEQTVNFAQTYAGLAAGRVVGFLASLVGIVATIVVIPVISVYLIFEAPTFLAAAIRVVPEPSRPKAVAIIAEMDGALGGFIRGQLTVGAVIGVCITIALLILHVKYALLIGVLAGLFDIIPYVGAIVGFVPSVLLALFNDGWQHAVLVAIVFVAIFQAEGHFISPRIVSDSVGLSPLSVIVAILIGGEIGGIGGMFLAVPIAALIRVIALQTIPGLRTEPEPAPAASIAEAAAVVGAGSSKKVRRGVAPKG